VSTTPTTASTPESSGGGAPRGYFEQSRDLLNSLVLVLPLLLVYQAGLLATNGQTLNGVDFITIVLVQRWQLTGLLVFNGVLIVAGIVGVVVLQKKRRFDPRIVVPIAIESTVYAFLLGIIITQILAKVGIKPPHMLIEGWTALAAGPGEANAMAKICMALGAGVNEELVFRLGMVPAIAGLAAHAMPKRHAVIVAILVSSILFSLAHYFGEPFMVYTFFYRFLAGVLFCALFTLRGFAVAVYTHAIYDVLVMVVLPR
jgi:membrane protease YdiL (CAAX protease family)